jgi:hypothetical protein
MVIFLTAPLMNFILPKFCLTVPGTEGSVLLENIASNFITFLFPVTAHIYFRIEYIKSTKFRTKYNASVLFCQGEKQAAIVKIEYSVYDKTWLAIKEAELAKETLLSLENVTI